MVDTEITVDAGFYNMIHQMISATEEGQFPERRGRDRKTFSTTQRIAVRRGPGVPDDREFIAVQCHDLSCSGFSFFLPNRPNFDSLVAALGAPPEVIYTAAEVVRCVDVLIEFTGQIEYVQHGSQQPAFEDFRGRTATPMVLVGCRFTERISN